MSSWHFPIFRIIIWWIIFVFNFIIVFYRPHRSFFQIGSQFVNVVSSADIFRVFCIFPMYVTCHGKKKKPQWNTLPINIRKRKCNRKMWWKKKMLRDRYRSSDTCRYAPRHRVVDKLWNNYFKRMKLFYKQKKKLHGVKI